MKVKLLIISAILILAAISIAILSLQAVQGVELSFETVSQGFGYPRYENHDHLVVRDPESWEMIWSSAVDGSVAPPEIDFEFFTVIALFMGERPTGGYAISVEGIVEAGNEVVVRVREIYPGRIFVTEALTWPHHIVKIERQQKPVILQLEQYRAHSFGEDGTPYDRIIFELIGSHQLEPGEPIPEPP